MWVAVESNHAPRSYQERVLTDELATLFACGTELVARGNYTSNYTLLATTYVLVNDIE